MNCYPNLGAPDVTVFRDGEVVCRLDPRDHSEDVLEYEPCTLEFRANRIFYAEETGETMDIGGLIGLDTFG